MDPKRIFFKCLKLGLELGLMIEASALASLPVTPCSVSEI